MHPVAASRRMKRYYWALGLPPNSDANMQDYNSDANIALSIMVIVVIYGDGPRPREIATKKGSCPMEPASIHRGEMRVDRWRRHGPSVCTALDSAPRASRPGALTLRAGPCSPPPKPRRPNVRAPRRRREIHETTLRNFSRGGHSPWARSP